MSADVALSLIDDEACADDDVLPLLPRSAVHGRSCVVKMRNLGRNGPLVSAIGLGCMRMSNIMGGP